MFKVFRGKYMKEACRYSCFKRFQAQIIPLHDFSKAASVITCSAAASMLIQNHEFSVPRCRLLSRQGGTERRLFSSGPGKFDIDKWRKLITKFQDTKMQKDGLNRYFINRDVGYGEFNKFGRINPWCILDYFEGSINLFNIDAEEFKQMSLFARNTEMHFQQGMEASIHTDKALKFNIRISYLGKSTVCWDAQCLDPSTEDELARYVIQMVIIDMKIRKPAPCAYHFKDACPENVREKPPQGFDLEFKPEDAFKHRFVVNWSDTDFNSHLNQADIHRMCFDSGSFAALKGKLSAFSRELVAYDFKRSSVMFMKEARPGEEVLVECWESESSPLILNFAFSKEGDLITMVQFEFYAGDEA